MTITADTEIRNLPDNSKHVLANYVSYKGSIRRLMLIIPKNIDDCLDKEDNYDKKYLDHHFRTIENATDLHKRGRPLFEILLDEWGTSGRNRPKIKHLIKLLDKVQLYRAANHLRTLIHEPEQFENNTIDIELTTGGTSDNLPNFAGLVLNDDLLDQLKEISTKRFNPTDLLRATQNFDSSKLIGKGGFGQVFIAKNLLDGYESVAVKRLTKIDERVMKKFVDEIKFLSKMNHVNIIKLIGYAIDQTPLSQCQLFLVYEYAQSGSLADRLKDTNQTYTFKERVKHLLDVAHGLKYLHVDHALLHRDIKPLNILLDLDVAKLCDFGLIKKLDSNSATVAIGTRFYIAPEMTHGEMTEKTDIFALGVVVLQTITGLPLQKENEPNYYLLDFCRRLIHNPEGSLQLIPLLQGFEENTQSSRLKLVKYALKCSSDLKDDRPNISEICEFFEAIYIN